MPFPGDRMIKSPYQQNGPVQRILLMYSIGQGGASGICLQPRAYGYAHAHLTDAIQTRPIPIAWPVYALSIPSAPEDQKNSERWFRSMVTGVSG